MRMREFTLFTCFEDILLYLITMGCHGANHFSLRSMAEQENAHDDKTKILLTDLLDFTRFSASVRKKISLKGRILQGLSRKYELCVFSENVFYRNIE